MLIPARHLQPPHTFHIQLAVFIRKSEKFDQNAIFSFYTNSKLILLFSRLGKLNIKLFPIKSFK